MDTTPDFAEERRAKILGLVQDRGRVRNSDLVALLHVSEPTIRKDLTMLERQRLLRRTHGGAIAVTPTMEQAIGERDAVHAEAKARIARACMAYINPGDAIFLDSGTTVKGIADLLQVANVNVLTNALAVASALASRADVRHTLLGGQVRPLGGSLVGGVTLDTLRQFTVNTAFIGASGIVEEGISVSDVAEGQIKRAAIDIARRVVVPIDSSKVGRADFYPVASLDRIDVIATDTYNEQLNLWCQDHGTQLIVSE